MDQRITIPTELLRQIETRESPDLEAWLNKSEKILQNVQDYIVRLESKGDPRHKGSIAYLQPRCDRRKLMNEHMRRVLKERNDSETTTQPALTLNFRAAET
ncbi:MAG: hypothetical protein A2751_03800 [Candidatus Doudnabacteria bacterium RIFCSPHIGHO2_01_FULL_46_14]|uniref:Uncharacterized protein n=1 Tax=Candidatus Doudnabacteria bacterium RIFCSPHIGHO2_01_FULL_46_14 TaxID=1817824 RepID=A0A1F5NKP4_9BACT|nr:MAG: hypothetical protein A2751_03800 [Candidatus Doudnabacteria bacterium RIFCSPHIGHO2_01_FULL_46_14]